jgi:tetratricopeptide (TPR) repeat protein
MDARTAQSLLDLAEAAGPELRGLEAKPAFERLEERYGDLQSALRWFIEEGRANAAFQLAGSLVVFWMATKRLDEGSAWFDRVLALPDGDDAQRGRASFDAGYLAFFTGNDERSSALQRQALELGRQTNTPTVTALALVGLARIALRTTGIEEARRLCREGLAVTEGTDDQLGRSNAIHVLGVAAQMAGDFLEAREWMRQRIALAREMGNLASVSYEAGNLSMVERQLGNLEEAEVLALEALGINHQRGDEWAIPYSLSGMAAIAASRGEFERAARLIGVAEAMMAAQGAAWPPDEMVHYERTLTALTEAMGVAAFGQARAAGRSMAKLEAVEYALGTRRPRIHSS